MLAGPCWALLLTDNTNIPTSIVKLRIFTIKTNLMPFHTFITLLRRPVFCVSANKSLPHSAATQRVLPFSPQHKKEVTSVALVPGFAVAVGISHSGNAVLLLVPCSLAETGRLLQKLGSSGIDPIQDVFG